MLELDQAAFLVTTVQDPATGDPLPDVLTLRDARALSPDQRNQWVSDCRSLSLPSASAPSAPRHTPHRQYHVLLRQGDIYLNNAYSYEKKCRRLEGIEEEEEADEEEKEPYRPYTVAHVREHHPCEGVYLLGFG